MIEDIEQVIRTRKSIRTYSNTPVEDEKKKSVLEFINSNSVGIFGTDVEFFLIDANSAEFKNIKLGTYGVISGTKYFITGKIKNSSHNFEDFGYCMEKLVLFCSQLNLVTCWLGGTYKKTAFSAAIDLRDDEIIPAVISVGYFDGDKSWVDKAFRYVARSDSRKPFDELFFSNSFNQKLTEQQKEKYGFYLEMVRLAPSASNKQPWRIVLSGSTFHFFLKRTPNYNKTILHSDLQRVDMGIGISHFDLSLSEKKISHQWVIEPPAIELDELVEYIASCEIR